MSAARRTMLIVDDDAEGVRAAKRALEDDGHRVEVAPAGEPALRAFADAGPALVLVDFHAYETLRRLRLRDAYVSILFASAGSSPADVVRGLDAGADGFVAKPYDASTLAALVRSRLRVTDLHDRLRAENKRLLELVDIDDLTELYNMRSIYGRLDQELSRAKRHGRTTSVVMMDLDDFKKVNDLNDHLFGSFVLKEVGKIIRQTIRSVDLGARFGGDEFLMILPETGVEGSMISANRVRVAIEAHPFQNKTAAARVTASFGVAVCEPSRREMASQALVRCADLALYEAKGDGKNCVRRHDIASIHGAFAPLQKKSAG